VGELRSIEGRLRLKYKTQLERRIERVLQHQNSSGDVGGAGMAAAPSPQFNEFKNVFDKAGKGAGAVAGAAGAFAGGFFAKVKSSGAAFGGLSPMGRANAPPATTSAEPGPTIVDLPPPTSTSGETEGDWAGTDIAAATDGISNFSIGDDEEDDML
jgi:hypothetical protein